ncbi:UNVERIFIED_CONTAM: hypothetical protein HDU68_007229, partial [Siphonaria sp. JEL0065]
MGDSLLRPQSNKSRRMAPEENSVLYFQAEEAASRNDGHNRANNTLAEKIMPSQTNEHRKSNACEHALKDENKRLQSELFAKNILLAEKQLELDNTQDQLEQRKLQLEQNALFMNATVSDLDSQLKVSLQCQKDLSKSLVKTKEELMQNTSKLAEKDMELVEQAKDVVQIKLQLSTTGLADSMQELTLGLKENERLIQGNLELGAQLSKLTTDFADNLWELRRVSSERDQMRLQITALEAETRNSKQKEANQWNSCPKRHWGTQTLYDESTSTYRQGIHDEEKSINLELEMKTQQKLIEILEMDSDVAKQESAEPSTDPRAVHMQIPGLKKEKEDFPSLGFASIIADEECPNCSNLTEKLNVALVQLEVELGKTKVAIQSRFTCEQEKFALSLQIIDLQRQLNTAADEIEFTKSQTEIRLKSYHEMKKLIAADREMIVRPVTTDLEEIGDVRIIIGSTSVLETMDAHNRDSLPKHSEIFNSTDLLANHLSRSSNIQLELNAVIREKVLLQEQLRKAELKVLMAEDEAKEFKAAEQRNTSFVTSQLQERVAFSEEICKLQEGIANQIIAKSALEAELLALKHAPEKKRSSLFKMDGNSIFGGSRSRASSTEKGGTPGPGKGSPTSPTAEIAQIEKGIIGERDKLAMDLVTKSKDITKLSQEIADLNEKLSKSRQETKELEDKTTELVRDHEELIDRLNFAHSEIEECLQNQVQELADQLMEPKPYSEDEVKGKPKEFLDEKQTKLDQAKLRQLQLELKESQSQIVTLNFKIDKLENESSHLRLKRDVENYVNHHLIDIAQSALETSEQCRQHELESLKTTISRLTDENEKLRVVSATRMENFNQTPSHFIQTSADTILPILQKKVAELSMEIEQIKPPKTPKKTHSTRKMSIKRDQESPGIGSIELSDLMTANDLEISNLKYQLAQLEYSLQSAQKLSDKTIVRLEKEVKSQAEEIQQLTALKESLRIQSSLLEAKVLDTTNLLLAKTDAYSLMVEEKTQLSNRIDTTMWKLQAVQERCAAAESKAAVLEAKSRRTSVSAAKVSECEGCAQLGATLKQLNSELIDWQSRCDKAGMDLNNAEWQKYALEAKLKAHETEIYQAKQQKVETDTLISEFRDQVSELKLQHRSDLSEAMSLQSNLTDQIVSLERDLKDAEKTIKQAVDAYNDLKATTSQNETATTKVAELTDKIEQLEISLNSAKNEIELYSLQSCRLSKSERTHAFNGLLEQLESKLETKDQLLEQYMKANSALKTETLLQNFKISELEMLAALKTKSLSETKTAQEKKEEKSAHIRNLESHVADLKSVVHQLETENEQLHSELSNLRHTHSMETSANPWSKSQELEILRLCNAEQAKLAAIHQTQLDTQIEKILEKDRQIESLQIDKNNLKAENSRIANQLEGAKARIEELIKLSMFRAPKLKGNENIIAELEMEISQLRKQINATSASGTKYIKSETVMISKLELKEETASSAELVKAKAKIDELIILSSRRSQKIQDQEISIASLKAHCDGANSTQNSASEDFQNLNLKLNSLRSKILEMTKADIHLKMGLKEKDSKILDLEAEIKQLQIEVGIGKTHSQSSSNLEIASLKSQLKRANSKLDELYQASLQNTSLIQEKNMQISALEDKVAALEKDLQTIQMQREVVNTECGNLKRVLEAKIADLKATENTVKDLEMQITELKEKITAREEEVIEVRKWLHESEEEFIKYSNEAHQLKHQVSRIVIPARSFPIADASTDSSPSTAVERAINGQRTSEGQIDP